MPQTATVQSACLRGLDVVPLTLNCQVTPGLPNFHILGVAGAGEQEAAARVRAAIRAAGFEMPHASVVVQAHPATVRAQGTQLDLAIAASILAATGQIPPVHDGVFLVGELTLRGDVMPVRGAVCYEQWCTEHGSQLASHVLVGNLADLRTPNWTPVPSSAVAPAPRTPEPLPEHLQAAFDAAMADHGVILLRGADGHVSRAVRELYATLPMLTPDQCRQLACIHSACLTAFEGEPSFRAPHHSITLAGLVGGGRPVIPGEVTLASHGMLLISDVERWSQAQLDAIACALRDGEVRIVRVEGICVMPAAPALVVATTTDTKTPAERLLRGLGSRLNYTEVLLS